MDKPAYTLDIHVQRLRKMLKTNTKPCSKCPARPEFKPHKSVRLWNSTPREICRICATFVHVKSKRDPDFYRCPCYYWGESEAIFKSWEAIEEYDEKEEK